MEALQTLSKNLPFLTGAYQANGVMTGLIVLALFDLALKGWAMWRAARMEKKAWFIALLVVNSFGIFPGIFLLTTNSQYQKVIGQKLTR